MSSVPQQKSRDELKSLSQRLTEMAVLALFALSGLQCWLFVEAKQSADQLRDVGHRLIQRMDTDSLITERALALLEGREPSAKSKQYPLRTAE